MEMNSSYNVSSFATSANAEIQRLNAQVELFWPAEGELLERMGLSNSMRLLDCGCGPGRLLQLIQTRFPNAQCEGIEIDSLLVEQANVAMKEAGIPIAIQQGSAENPGFPEETFDVIVMRLVLEHLPAPNTALTALTKILKPGGKLVVISNDFDFHLRTHPHVAELDTLYNAYCRARREDRGDPCIGRRVPQLLASTGLVNIASQTEQAHNAIIGDHPFLKAEGSGIPAQLVNDGYLDESVLESLTRNWVKMLQTPGHCITRQLWIAGGERPRDWSEATVSDPAQDLTHSETAPRAYSTEMEVTDETVLQLVRSHFNCADISATDYLDSFGMDSLTAIAFQERVKAETSVNVSIRCLLEKQTIAELIAFIVSESKQVGATSTPQDDGTSNTSEWDEGEL